jgi:hypothetical protein
MRERRSVPERLPPTFTALLDLSNRIMAPITENCG